MLCSYTKGFVGVAPRFISVPFGVSETLEIRAALHEECSSKGLVRVLKGETALPIGLKKPLSSTEACLTELCFYSFKNAGFLLS